MIAVAHAQLTVQMLTLLQKYFIFALGNDSNKPLS